MNGKKVFEVTVRETRLKTYVIEAKDEREAQMNYEKGEVVTNTLEDFETQKVEVVE